MFPTLLGCVISMKLLKSFDEPVPPRRLKESCLMTCFKPWQKKYNFGQIVHLGRSPQIYTRHKKIMSNLISRSSLIIFGNSSRYTGPICKTCLIFYGTFKSHESHCNTHIFKCYRRPVTAVGRYYRPLVDNRHFGRYGWYSWFCGRCYIKMVDRGSNPLAVNYYF